MQCKQAEKFIIDASQTDLDSKVKDELEIHIMNCPKCERKETRLIKNEFIEKGKYAGWKKRTFRCLYCNKDFVIKVGPAKKGVDS